MRDRAGLGEVRRVDDRRRQGVGLGGLAVALLGEQLLAALDHVVREVGVAGRVALVGADGDPDTAGLPVERDVEDAVREVGRDLDLLVLREEGRVDAQRSGRVGGRLGLRCRVELLDLGATGRAGRDAGVDLLVAVHLVAGEVGVAEAVALVGADRRPRVGSRLLEEGDGEDAIGEVRGELDRLALGERGRIDRE